MPMSTLASSPIPTRAGVAGSTGGFTTGSLAISLDPLADCW